MKTKKDIEKKLAQVRFRHLKKALRKGLSRKPENCVYNAKLGKGSKPDAPRVGVCMYKVEVGAGPKGVCDDCFGGQNRASDCMDFEPRQDASDIRKDFESFLHTASKGEIAFHYPDLAALLWTLGEHPSLESVIPDDEVTALVEEVIAPPELELVQIEESTPDAGSWWNRFVIYVRRTFLGWF